MPEPSDQGNLNPTAPTPSEPEVVRTTIVGGRPPGKGRGISDIPRGIEVLVKKASVDPQFKALLLARRDAAAEEIDLKLDPAEAMMLRAVPAEQLETIIAGTKVDPGSRRAFLGKAAAAMLAAIGVSQVGCGCMPAPTGVRPDTQPATQPKPPRPGETCGSTRLPKSAGWPKLSFIFIQV